MEEMGVDPKSLKLKAGVSAQSHGRKPCAADRTGLNLLAWVYTAFRRIMGPGVASDCEYKQGLHIAEEIFFLAEIIGRTLGAAALRQRRRARDHDHR